MIRRRRVAVGCVCAVVSALFTPASEAPAHAIPTPGIVVEVPLEFDVRNVNGSKVPCLTDERPYTVRGHLVAPRAAVGRQNGAVTVYLHGGLVRGEVLWRFSNERFGREYDYAHRMARDFGHASIVLDRLGWGSSDIPPSGFLECMGSQADIAHQIVLQLRHGTYTAEGIHPPAFARVALAGHSGGVQIVQAEAYSFGDVDAIILIDQGLDGAGLPLEIPLLSTAEAFGVCARGGEQKWTGEPLGGYAFIWKGETDFLFHDADPDLKAAVAAEHERDSCGEGLSIGSVVAANRVYLSQIAVPVLLVFGRESAAAPPPAGETQSRQYPNAEVTLVEIEDAGHMLMFERVAPDFRVAVSRWLTSQGL